MDGISGVGSSYSSAVPNCCDAKFVSILGDLPLMPEILARSRSHEKLAIRSFLNCASLIFCATHKKRAPVRA